MSNKFCGNCGTPIAEGQQFCSGCGAPQAAPTPEPVPTATMGTPSAIDQFNAGIEQQAKKKGNMKKLIFIIPAIIVLLIVASKFIGGGFTEGTYKYITMDSKEIYTFADGTYTYTDDEDTETGTYVADGKEVTLTDSEGETFVMVQDGEYLYKKKSYYKQLIPEGERFSQTISVDNTITLKGSTYDLHAEWVFSEDGTYTWKTTLGLGSYTSTMSEVEGTYTRDGKILKLKPSDDDFTKTYLVIDGYMYYSVYKIQ